MRKRARTVLRLALAAFVASASSATGALQFTLTDDEVRAASIVDPDELAETVRVLSAIGSRVPGAGTRAAADYVRGQFDAAGLSDVRELPFTTTVPVQREASIEAQGVTVLLDACWPNLVRTCSTPRDGVRGVLVYAGGGTYSEFDGKPVEGSIVAIDYNSGQNWLNVPALGGRAVLFIEPGDTTQFESASKFLRTPVNVPRFYVTKKNWERLVPFLGTEVKLCARVEWQDVTESNIAGWVRGSGALRDRTVVLSSYYDAMSVVPTLAPGAEQACGIAALIDLARYFAEKPPARSVLFLATSGHGLYMQGVSEFFDAQMAGMGVAPDLFIALDLASTGDRVGAFNAGHAYWDNLGARRLPSLFAPLGTHLGALAHRTALLTGLYTAGEYTARGMERNPTLSPFVESLSGTSLLKAGVEWRALLPQGMAHEAETAMLFGHLGFCFATWGAERFRVDSPLDTFERFNRENLAAQVRSIKPMLDEMLNNDAAENGFITRIEDILDWERQAHRAVFFPASGTNNGIVTGRVVEFVPRKNYIPDEPKTDALVVIRQEFENTYPGVRSEPVRRVWTVAHGASAQAASFRFANIGRGIAGGFADRSREIDAYVLDPDSGDIVYAKDRGRNGEETYPTVIYKYTTPPEVGRTVAVFPCKAVDVFDLYDPRYLQPLAGLRVLDARTNSDPESFGVSFSEPVYDNPYSEACATIFIQRRQGAAGAFKLLGSAGIFGQRLALLNATRDVPTGVGIAAECGAVFDTPLRAARDMYLLNDSRMKELVRSGILPAPAQDASTENASLLSKLHVDAQAELVRAETAFSEQRYADGVHASRSAWALASRAYPLVRKVKNDAVVSVLFYLALLLPSAVFLERLLFGFPDIKRQIVGRAAIFLTVFALLRVSNAAFGLAVNPYIVLLGFIMIALTAAVLRIIWGMFQEELKRLRSQVTGVHNVEIGRSEAAGVAFGLGISSMRKRKIRTANTLITIVLLTFSVLSFTSVVSRNTLKGRPLYDIGMNRIHAPYDGILFRTALEEPLGRETCDYLASEFKGAAMVSPRAWYPPGTKPMNAPLRVDAITGKSASVSSALGLSSQEAGICLTNPGWLKGSWFSGEDRYAVLLTESVAGVLGLDAGAIGRDAIEILGRRFVVRGIVSDELFDEETGFRDIDGEIISPVNYALSQAAYQEVTTTRADIVARRPPPTFSHYPAGGTIILPFQTVLELGGTTRSIAFVAADSDGGGGAEALRMSERLLRDKVLSKLTTGLFAGMDGLSYWYTSLGQSDFKGMSSLIVLIAIAALIVFNTILGSLYERQREIGIYTSLGLAPAHIGAFFLAESCVYAVLGCLFGYLLGQVVSVVRVNLDVSLLKYLTLDYSSESALIATLLVGGVVLASSLYPAWKASRLSVPELERSVKLPAPVDDAMSLEFPFVFTGGAQLGVLAFLTRYFREHEELATGHFHAQSVCLDAGQGTPRIRARVWLAPFDWGISQDVLIEVRVSGGESALFLTVRRIEGEVTAWQRVNRRFIARIRRQLLLWRTLGPEHRADCIASGRLALAADVKSE